MSDALRYFFHSFFRLCGVFLNSQLTVRLQAEWPLRLQRSSPESHFHNLFGRGAQRAHNQHLCAYKYTHARIRPWCTCTHGRCTCTMWHWLVASRWNNYSKFMSEFMDAWMPNGHNITHNTHTHAHLFSECVLPWWPVWLRSAAGEADQCKSFSSWFTVPPPVHSCTITQTCARARTYIHTRRAPILSLHQDKCFGFLFFCIYRIYLHLKSLICDLTFYSCNF